MAPNIQVYTSDGVTLVTSIAITGNSPGSPSSPLTYRLVNDDSGGSVDTAPSPALILRAEDEGGDLVTEGVRALDERWIEVETTGVSSDAVTSPATGWVPVGRNRWFNFVELPEGEWVQFRIRDNRPGSAPSGEIVYDIALESGQIAQTLELGHSENYRDGILTGLNDGTWGEAIYVSGDVTAQGSPDDTVQLPDLAWRCIDGEPRVLLSDALTIDNLDGSAAALIAGEAYYDVLSLAADGTITETKGDKATTPLDPLVDAPDVPSGEIPLARVHREFDDTIESADIVQLYTLGAYQMVTSGASLNVTIGAGRAMVDNRLIRRTAESVFALSVSETSYIWLLSSGSFSVTEDVSRPAAGVLLFYIATTDGSGVTDVLDRREWIGGERVDVSFQFQQGTIAGTEDVFLHFGKSRAGYVWPIRGASLAVGSNGSGNAAGQLRVDVLATDGVGGAFTTIFTTAAQRPTVVYNDTEPVAYSGLTEVCKIEPGARLEAQLSFPVAYDSTGPSDASVSLTVFLV